MSTAPDPFVPSHLLTLDGTRKSSVLADQPLLAAGPELEDVEFRAFVVTPGGETGGCPRARFSPDEVALRFFCTSARVASPSEHAFRIASDGGLRRHVESAGRSSTRTSCRSRDEGGIARDPTDVRRERVTYAPRSLKSPESRPSEPKMTALLPCSFICRPKICAFDAICHGRKTTSTCASRCSSRGPRSRSPSGRPTPLDRDADCPSDLACTSFASGLRVRRLVVDDEDVLRLQRSGG